MTGEVSPISESVSTETLNEFLETIKEEENKIKKQLKRQPYHDDERSSPQNNFVILDFVAIPPNFDISSFLSLREQVGISRYREIDLEQVKIMAEGIKHSPVLAVLNNHRMKSGACLYLLSIIEELGLVVKSIDNPIRRSFQQYENYLKNRGPKSHGLNIIIVNIFPLLGDNIIEESLEIAKKLQSYQNELDESIDKVANLD